MSAFTQIDSMRRGNFSGIYHTRRETRRQSRQPADCRLSASVAVRMLVVYFFRIVVFAVVEQLARTDSLLRAFLLDHVGQHILNATNVLDVQYIELGARLVARAAVYRSKSEHPLPERALQCEVGYPIEPDFILGSRQKALVDNELILFEPIARERPRQTEDYALSILPDDILGVDIAH